MPDEPSGYGAKRFVRPLPSNPNLDKQRKLAKALARDYWRGESEAIERIAHVHACHRACRAAQRAFIRLREGDHRAAT